MTKHLTIHLLLALGICGCTPDKYWFLWVGEGGEIELVSHDPGRPFTCRIWKEPSGNGTDCPEHPTVRNHEDGMVIHNFDADLDEPESLGAVMWEMIPIPYDGFEFSHWDGCEGGYNAHMVTTSSTCQGISSESPPAAYNLRYHIGVANSRHDADIRPYFVPSPADFE